MNEQTTHQMKVSNVYESGAQEWLCLECERRVLISWTSGFKRIVLEAGDDRAVHTGSFGGIEIGLANAQKDNFAFQHEPLNGKEILH